MTTRTFVVNSTTGKRSIIKDPNDELDYTADWADWLAASANDTIQSVAWAITGDDSVLVQSNSTSTATTATVKLTGGTVGKTYGVRCRITTVGARIKDDTFYVKVKEQ
jgi:hypothetical protein